MAPTVSSKGQAKYLSQPSGPTPGPALPAHHVKNQLIPIEASKSLLFSLPPVAEKIPISLAQISYLASCSGG